MKKRLRKKLKKGEFTEYGFEIEITFNDNVTEQEFDKWINSFIEEIEKNNLLFGGASGLNNFEGFVTSVKKSVTENQKLAIENWISKQKIIKKYSISELIDAWK